jgi:hypothetical protein
LLEPTADPMKTLISLRLGCLLILGSALVSGAQNEPDDAALYYRRTHGGAMPPAGVDPSDHSGETDAVVPAKPVVIVRRPQTDRLDRGVDAANLGKGDWIWRVPESAVSLGLASTDVQGMINQAKAAGLKWITVKCGDRGNVWTQFNTDLINRAHAAGLLIFGWAYVYGGADTDAEINVALNALNLGADGFIIDAEIEYEAVGQKANATKYAGAIKAAFPNRFLAHAPFPIISSHPAYPYVEFGTLCDAVMPQAYWADIGGTAYAATMVTRMNTEWNNWQNSLIGTRRNAIKPIVPIGQAYNSVKGNVDGPQIETFMAALKTIPAPATTRGFKGVSFWSFQHQNTAPTKWPAISAATIGDSTETNAPVPWVAVFQDDFDSTAGSGWTVNRSSTDTLATFGYDYAADGIVAAPHSTGGTTRGVKLEVNRSAGAAAALSLSPAGRSFSGDYRLRFDAWINVNGPLPGGGVGSTEFLTAGVGTTGDRVQRDGAGSTADGIWVACDGDGGVSDTTSSLGDYSVFVGTSLQPATSGVYASGTEANARGNFHPYNSAAVPGGVGAPAVQQAAYAQQTGAINPGAAGFAWHEVIVAHRGSAVDWFIDGVRMATVPGASTAPGNVFVGYWDPYASISDNAALSFGLVDNVRVEVPATAPILTLSRTNISVKLGGAAQFAVVATGAPDPIFQWLFQGAPLAGETHTTLILPTVGTHDVGAYSVVASNLAGSVTSMAAQLTVLPAAAATFQSITVRPDLTLQLSAAGETGGLYLLEASTNLVNWSEVGSQVATNGGFRFDLAPGQGMDERFFRARSWP